MENSALVFVAGGVLVVLLAISAYIFHRMLRPGPGTPNVVATSASSLNLAPMQRLLASEDFEFLQRQPGFHPEMLTRLRAQRASLFSAYLGSVQLEFHRLHSQLRHLVVQSGIDNPMVTRSLLQQRMLFSVRLVQVRYRLFLFRLGFDGLDTSSVTEAIRQLREQVAQLQVAMPAIAPSAA
ncbi:MAG: hypothetical protein HY820_34940 [Acidobacteria bacterium]|nr:hypothetical protein [Acidobacteriota bacterium]